MYYPDLAFLPPQYAFEMRQTAHIRPGDIFGAMPEMVRHPILTHLHGHRFFPHAKSTAKTTAFVHAVERHQLYTIYHV